MLRLILLSVSGTGLRAVSEFGECISGWSIFSARRRELIALSFLNIDFITSKRAMLVLINGSVSLFPLLGFLPPFSCLKKKILHSKQNPLCPRVWPLLGEVREAAAVLIWGRTGREGEMVRITDELQRKGKFCSTHHTSLFQFFKSHGKTYLYKWAPWQLLNILRATGVNATGNWQVYKANQTLHTCGACCKIFK